MSARHVARLILLNGPPGIGKSTLARRWVADQERAVVVEIDALRTSLDGWQDDESSKLEARRLAIEVADAHLRGGFDVIVPQYLGRIEFMEELAGTAVEAGAAFIEVILTADEDLVVERFESRRRELAGAGHPEHEVDDIRSTVGDAISRLEVVAQQRPATVMIPHHDANVTLAELEALFGAQEAD